MAGFVEDRLQIKTVTFGTYLFEEEEVLHRHQDVYIHTYIVLLSIRSLSLLRMIISGTSSGLVCVHTRLLIHHHHQQYPNKIYIGILDHISCVCLVILHETNTYTCRKPRCESCESRMIYMYHTYVESTPAATRIQIPQLDISISHHQQINVQQQQQYIYMFTTATSIRTTTASIVVHGQLCSPLIVPVLILLILRTSTRAKILLLLLLWMYRGLRMNYKQNQQNAVEGPQFSRYNTPIFRRENNVK